MILNRMCGENMKTVAVIGAGPAGMSAAIAAARNGAKVVVFERNDIAMVRLAFDF